MTEAAADEWFDDADRARITGWLRGYRSRVRADGTPDAERRQRMNAVNPKYVLRNYLAQLAIDKAEAGETVVITRHGKPVVRLVADQEARKAKVREIFDWMFAERAKRPGATVEEILEMRDEGRRF